MNEQKLKKKLMFMIVTVILLICGLTVTSFALVSSIVSIRSNRFTMSMGVELTINDGKPVVDVTDMVYEPGGTYQSEFPIANLGTFDVWYRVYFTNVDGELKDDITVTIKEKDGTVLCKGTMNQLTADKVMTGSLAAGESKTLTPNVEIYTYWGTSSQSERDFANGLYYLDCEETDPAALVVTPTQTEPTNAAETTPTTETTETEASSPEVVE